MFMLQPIALFVVVFILPCLSAGAQTAYDITRKAEDKMRGATASGTMTITIKRPTWSREMSMKVWSKGNTYSLILILSPDKDKGITFLKRGKEVWNWIPALERTIKLPPSMMSQSWMGSDFTNDDLVKESSLATDFVQSFAGDSIIDGRSCYRIELVPKPTASVVWGKIITYIDRKDFLQLRSEFYDEDGALVNIMSGSDIRLLGGKLLPSVFELYPADKPGNTTIIRYRSLLFDQPIDDSFFSTQTMRLVK